MLAALTKEEVSTGSSKPNWVFLVFRIVLGCVLLFFIIWSYSHFPQYGDAWFIIVLCCLFLISLGWEEISEFEIWKVFRLRKKQPGEALSKEQRDEVRSEAEKPVEDTEQMNLVLAKHDLSVLLSNYSFFYGRQDAPSDIIRFSDAFSGRPLRYIDHFSQDLNQYLSKYSRFLKEPLLDAVQALRQYIDDKKKYHKKEEKLSQPVFSAQQYSKLVKDVVASFRTDNFQS